MASYVVDSTKANTSLVAAGGTITGISVAVVPTGTDLNTQVCLTDGPVGRTLWAATLPALAFLWEPKPGFDAPSGGTVRPPFPRAISPYSISFANGIFVKSCPPGISLTVTA